MDVVRRSDFRRTEKSALPIGLVLIVLALPNLASSESRAGPSAEIAKRCFRYSYIAFPYKQPGSVPMSGDGQAYFKDCMAREGNVPEPSPAPKPSQ